MSSRKHDATLLILGIQLLIVTFCFIGEIRCIYKFCKCDFKQPYKAEIVYGIGSFTGAGAIIGWININD